MSSIRPSDSAIAKAFWQARRAEKDQLLVQIEILARDIDAIRAKEAGAAVNTQNRTNPMTDERALGILRNFVEYHEAPEDGITLPALNYIAARLAERGASDGRMSDETRAWLEGMSVSVDVSTCDADAQHRYMGTITEVMDDRGDKHGVTLLVQDAEPNFERGAGVPEGLGLMRSAFITQVSCGPDSRYEMVFKFKTLADLQQAYRDWIATAPKSAPKPEDV